MGVTRYIQIKGGSERNKEERGQRYKQSCDWKTVRGRRPKGRGSEEGRN